MAKEEEIRLIAYSIWEQENCPNGRDCEHWYRAEAILEQQQKAKSISPRTHSEAKGLISKTQRGIPKRKR